MSKIYAAPKLVAKGDVMQTTKAAGGGSGDPIDTLQSLTPGSVGFGL